MSTPATSPSPAGDGHKVVPVDATNASFEDKLQAFWERNRGTVTAVLVVIVLAILAKGGWDYVAEQHEQSVREAFAASTTPDQLKDFAASHADHPLAAVALLKLADDAYAAGKYDEAAAGYQKVLSGLKDNALTSRVRFGLAMAKLLGGHAAEAETAFNAIASDTNESKSMRAEAAYELAAMASSANNVADVKKYTEQVMAIDPSGLWTPRAMALRQRYPAEAMTAPATGPAIKLDAPVSK